MGIRAEDIEVALESRPDAIPVELDAVTPLNVRAVLYLRGRDGNELLATVTEDDAAALRPRATARSGRAVARALPAVRPRHGSRLLPAGRLRRPAWPASPRPAHKIYRSRGKPPVLAVDKVDLAANEGEIVAPLGSSGCGKTTTLRMIAGFEDVTSRHDPRRRPADPRLPPKDAASPWPSRATRSIRR